MKLTQDIEANLPGRALVLDLKNLLYMDSSGVDALHELIKACQKSHVRLIVCGLSHQPLDIANRSRLVNLIAPHNQFTDLGGGLASALDAPRP